MGLLSRIFRNKKKKKSPSSIHDGENFNKKNITEGDNFLEINNNEIIAKEVNQDNFNQNNRINNLVTYGDIQLKNENLIYEKKFENHKNGFKVLKVNKIEQLNIDYEETEKHFKNSVKKFADSIVLISAIKLDTANPKKYNKQGFNVFGYSKTGLLMSEFNENGYDKNGYNPFGYNKDGYDKNGYDSKGFDCDGFNKLKLNIDGFDCFGYDINRYNKDGFCITGFDKVGFDEFGFDCQGYDTNGYNKEGFDRHGFNKDGFNIFGHHNLEYDKEGYLKKTGYNDFGFDVNGYDEDGYDQRGYNELGYNREGFTESGYDQNGYNSEGYNSEGYNQLGYNKFGYNREGFDENGFDHEGYNREGFNLSGYDQSGFDKDGYDIYGYDRKGFTAEENRLLNTKKTKVNDLKEGDIVYSNVFGALEIVYREKKIIYLIGEKLGNVPLTNGKDIKEFAIRNKEKNLNSNKYGKLIYFRDYANSFVFGDNFVKEVKRFELSAFESKKHEAPYLFLNVPESWIQAEDGFDENVFAQESKFLANVSYYVREQHFAKLMSKIEKKWEEKYKKDNPMYKNNYISDTFYKNSAKDEFNRISGQIKREAYFASFMLNDKQVYLGRNEIISPSHNIQVASWTDKKIAQYYYQYDAYVGNKNTGLSLVRDYTIVQDRLFMYFDKFNATVDQNTKDDRMTKLLQAHRNDKRVTDIVNSIQKQQYEIMSQDINEELLVLGCAGSGKTMILFHRLSYILSNFEFDINDIFLISPTNLLAVQTDQLSKILNIDQANRLTVQQFMFNIYRDYCNRYGLYNTLIGIESINNFEYDLNYFNLSNLQSYLTKTKEKLNSEEYKDKEYRRVYNSLNHVKKLIIGNKETEDKCEKEQIIQSYLELNRKSLSICKKYSFRNIELMQDSMITYMEDLEEFSLYIDLILLFKQNHLLTGIQSKEQKILIRKIKSNNSLINEILEPLFKLTRGYDIASLMKMKFETPKLFIEYLIQNSKKLMSTEIEDIKILLNKVIMISEELADTIIEICGKAHEDYSLAKIHYNVLEYLKLSNYIGKEDVLKNGEVYGIDLNSYKQFDTVFELFDRFNWNQEIDEKYQLYEDVKDPFDFYATYEYLDNRISRFKEFKSGNQSKYIFDLIYDLINPNKSIFQQIKKCTYDQLFALTYILVHLYGIVENQKKIIFIDEFQDLSISEIMTIKVAYPNSIFNFYGDVFQCINIKGIHDKKTLNDLFSQAKQFEIMVNYRNAQEITEYVNNQMPFVEKMIPTGIKGEIKEIIRDENEIRHALKYNESDRIAYIVKDKTDVTETIYNSLEMIDISKYESNNIPRGRVMLYSIQEAKGLEFDIVVVDDKNMSVNEKYVAYTRALNKLFVIK